MAICDIEFYFFYKAVFACEGKALNADTEIYSWAYSPDCNVKPAEALCKSLAGVLEMESRTKAGL